MSAATILTDSFRAESWTNLSVTRSLKDTAGTFNFQAVEGEGGVTARSLLSIGQILPPMACKILLGGVQVINGFIEDRDVSYDSSSRGVQLSGRSITADLVESSADIAGGEYKNADLAQIANAVAAPYGITVKVVGDVGLPFANESVIPGESPFEFVERLARARGFALHDDAEGNWVLEQYQAATPVASLIEGQNILAASGKISAKNRFSETKVKGQSRSTDERNGSVAAETKAAVSDGFMSRHRPKIILAEGPVDDDDARQRADWEVAQAGADSLSVSITVQGWFGPHGLWEPGQLIYISSPSTPVARNMLCEKCVYTRDENGGTLTKMDFVLPETYTTKPASSASSGSSSDAFQGTEASGRGSAIDVERIWESAKPAVSAS